MPRRTLILSLGVAVCLALLVFGVQASYDDKEENHGPTVKVTVTATDASGGILRYRWRSTDGSITNVNAPTTTWVLPSGTGLHFAYVLVSNGLGGYTERRLAINTDTFAGESESGTGPRLVIAAPPAPAQQGDYYRSFTAMAQATSVDGTMHDVYTPGVPVYLQDLSNPALRYPPNSTVLTDLKGQYIIAGVPPGNYSANCSFGGTPVDCTNIGTATMLSDASGRALATSDYAEPLVGSLPSAISGSLTLDDHSPCGTINEFFGIESTARATLRDASGATLATARVNEFGDYVLPSKSNAASVLLQCENAAPVEATIPALDTNGGADLGPAKVAGVNPPTVAGMSASLNGNQLNATTSPVALFLPPHTQFPDDVPPTDFPSNILARADGFLASKGLDTRRGACQYYKAVGAVANCGASGNLIGPVSFNDWQRAVKIGRFATDGVPTFKASYINAVDLNLARVHQSISYGPNQTAAVVCNHLGIPISTAADFLSPAQSEIDTAVDNAVHNKNLVACVAMDYMVRSGVNNNQPFIRFLIFGPSGQLLPSINLDERREKFVPGTCVVCHGGDHYAGKFPEDGSGFADVGGHFLPYDVGNFEFSSKLGLTKCAQEEAIYNLNKNVLNAGPTAAERDLIAGWYAKGLGPCASNMVHVLDEFFVPPSWQGISTAATDFYTHVNARSCRTCHVAMIDTKTPNGTIASYNFDQFAGIVPGSFNNRFPSVDDDFRINLCGASGQLERAHMMPNSLNTFNRFWLSDVTKANTTGLPIQPALFTGLYTFTDAMPCADSPGAKP
ncbi:MAG: hypothetical protein DMG54_09485 [Acidobacteria bacterium]|nr:MAG: hypothetical protein DMG54_09485 [Acidobacteriota bacterium]PYU68315.1 MAG: hypothetical protein DMG52_31900 [Acidobacteriota bacterium]